MGYYMVLSELRFRFCIILGLRIVFVLSIEYLGEDGACSRHAGWRQIAGCCMNLCSRMNNLA